MSKLYVLKCDDQFKIGVSMDVSSRVKQLQTGNGNKIEVVIEEEFYHSAYTIEAMLHKKYYAYRTIGEWFKLDDRVFKMLELDVKYEVDKLALVGTIDAQREYTRLMGLVKADPKYIYTLLVEMANMKFKIEEVANDDNETSV